MAERAERRTARLVRNIAFLFPTALATGLCLALRTEPASLIAPAFGPWAGLLYGHGECTLGNLWPVGSVLLLVGGLVTFAALPRTRQGLLRSLLVTAAVGCVMAWEGSALLSVLNTTE